MARLPIYLEAVKGKTFACAIDWPGWSRSGKNDEAAIEALASYAERYRPIAERAGLTWPKTITFDVVETIAGNGATSFGVPGVVPAVDREPATPAGRKRMVALTEAAWAEYDAILARTSPTLKKGPRGGGRDRDPIDAHVLGAESAYLRQIGLKIPAPERSDPEALAAVRAQTLEAIRTPGEPKKWPIPYFVRRLIWHVLDHAWEMQDKTLP